MPHPTPPAGAIERLLQFELSLLGADPADTIVSEALGYARQLDDHDLAPLTARTVARRLNAHLLALQSAYWRVPTLPPRLSEAMHARAAAVHARLDESRPSRRAAISVADREKAYLDAYAQRAELAQLEASESLRDADG